MDELLKQISQNPDSIAEFTADQVTDAKAALKQFLADVKAGEVEADSAILAEVSELNSKLTERGAELEAARAEYEAKIAELEAALADPEEEEAVETPEAEADTEEAPAEEAPETEEVEPEKELVTASAKVEMGGVAKRIPAERKPRVEGPALVASGGERVSDPLRLAELSIPAMRNLQTKNDPQRVARFTASSEFVIDDGGSEQKGAQVLAEVRRKAQAHAQANKEWTPDAVTAALAFCAPAQPVYEQFGNISTDGLLMLPTVTASRGRITYPTSPSYQTLTGDDGLGEPGIGTNWDGAGNKSVFTFVCPDTVTCAVTAYVTILQFNNATARFYPEAVADLNTKALATAAQTTNIQHIANLVANAKVNTLQGEDTGAGAIVNIANNIAYHAAEYREKFRLSKGAVLDAVFPHWVFDVLWVDAYARDSTNDFSGVRARLSAMLNEANIRPQFVYGWQDIAPDLFGTFPAAVDVMLWEPGTVVRLDSGTLDLGVVRDSTLNATNDYQTFVETFEAVCVPGHEVLLINDIPICPNGSTGARVTINCAATPS